MTANRDMKVAIKAIPKNKLGNTIELIREEIEILRTLDHPNIIKYYESFESDKFMYIVMEYCSGGELFEMLTNEDQDHFTEQAAKNLMLKLFQAINHCHANNIAH